MTFCVDHLFGAISDFWDEAAGRQYFSILDMYAHICQRFNLKTVNERMYHLQFQGKRIGSFFLGNAILLLLKLSKKVVNFMYIGTW